MSFLRIDLVSHSVSDAFLNFIPQAFYMTVLLIIICAMRGEEAGWRWAGKRITSNAGKVVNMVIELFGFVLFAQSAGIVGSLFNLQTMSTWYVMIAKPEWTPPGWVFAPVWIVLYAMMGVAAWIVWRLREKIRSVHAALLFFGAHMVVNAAWSIVFFGMKEIGLAFGVIVALWLMIGILIVMFGKVRRSAGWLLVPYFAWVTFAMVLNGAIWTLNM